MTSSFRIFQTAVLLIFICGASVLDAQGDNGCSPVKILDIELTQPYFDGRHGAFIQALQAHLIRALGSTDNFFLTHFLNMEPNELLRVFHAMMLFLERSPGKTAADRAASQHLIAHPMSPAEIKARLMSAEALIRHELRRKDIPFERLVFVSTPGVDWIKTCQQFDSPHVIGKFINSLMGQDHHTRSQLEQLLLGTFYRFQRVNRGYDFATGDRLATPHDTRRWDPIFDFMVYQITDVGELFIHTMGEIKHLEHASAIRQMQGSIQRIRRQGLRIDGTFYSPEKIFIRSDNDSYKPLTNLTPYPGDTQSEALQQTAQFRHAMVHLFMTTKNQGKFRHIEDWGDVQVGTLRRKGEAQRIAFIGGLTPFLEAVHHLVLFYMTQPELQTRIRQMAMEYHFTYDHFVRSYLHQLRNPPSPSSDASL